MIDYWIQPDLKLHRHHPVHNGLWWCKNLSHHVEHFAHDDDDESALAQKYENKLNHNNDD